MDEPTWIHREAKYAGKYLNFETNLMHRSMYFPRVGGGGSAGKGRGFEKIFDQIPQGGKRNISPTPREKNLNKQYYNTT